MSSSTRQILPQPCSHLTDFRSKHGSQPFRVVQKCLRVRPLGRAEIRRDPLEVPRCASCGASASSRLYACIACASLFCHSPKLAASHAAQHASPGHEIAVDIDRAELFCCVCCDQVYDREFDTGVVLAQQRAASSLGGQLSLPVPQEKGRKRMRLEPRPWRPDPTEELLMATGSTTLQRKSEGESSASTSTSAHLPWGLRGLNNLGSTCFMNSVLQALLHAPPLRDYFLSDRHNRYICYKKDICYKKANSSGNGISNGRVGSENVKNSNLCLACDMDALFSAVFSGDRMPYSPAKFLYSWWQHAANLASYEQQDAHEFFISMLDGIHEKVKERGKFHDQGNGTCCIAHRVFSGILRSDVTCTACGFTSTTYDPCVDISLDLEPNQGVPAKASAKPQQALNGGGESTTLGQHSGVATLLGCLDHFTRPERLGSDQKFFCQQCQVRQESLKQMSIRKLPLVSCFHIKRFEHSSTRKTSRKVDRYLQFPFSLDMSSYVSSSILRSRFGNRIVTFEDEESNSPNDIPSEFELFAVVTHTGTLDSGHYVTYLRLNNQWYKCDDAWISQVSESIVRAAQAYMMFYVQKVLYFKASERFLATDPAVN